MTLETATPTFGLDLPVLMPWTLSVYQPPPIFTGAARRKSAFGSGSVRKASKMAHGMIQTIQMELDEEENIMATRTFLVTSKGDINATFQVPGLISVPTDGSTHKVTVCELELDATMSWVVVPKKSVKVHLTVCFYLTSTCVLELFTE